MRSESPNKTSGHGDDGIGDAAPMDPQERGNGDAVLKENGRDGEREANENQSEGGKFMLPLLKRMKEVMRVEKVDEETARNVERIAIIRISTKHINLWMRQLDMERKEICELAGLMELEVVKKEIEEEESIERWAKRCTNHFTKKLRRLLYEEIDNIVWSDERKVVSQWCKRNKIYDEITEDEIEEIWEREEPGREVVRLNVKYVWETAKRVCDYINTHEGIIHITSFHEYREVMRKIMKVIKEAHNLERKRRQTTRKRKNDEAKKKNSEGQSVDSQSKERRIEKGRDCDEDRRDLRKGKRTRDRKCNFK